MNELIEKLEEYIEAITAEAKEMVVIASVHGWKSSRSEEGVRLRKEIAELKEGYELDDLIATDEYLNK